VTDPHGKAPHPWWLSLLKIPYYLLDYGLGYYLMMRPRLVRSTLILFDRYYDDLLVDPRRYRYSGPHRLARLARYFVPRPDLIFVIDVSEEELLARKQEVSHKELGRQREAYRKLAAELPNAVLLDGSLTPKEVARNASEAILDYLHMRYLKRRHLWIRDNGSETLNWQESVLFSSKKARLVLLNSTRDGPKTQWQTNGAFGWLSLKDGRGYLIPMDSRQTRIKALRLYNAQNLKARVSKKLLAIGLNGHFCWPLLHKVQVLIRQDMPERERTKTSLLEYLKELLGRQELTFAISLSTPGPHRKPVIQALTHAGEILAYVKVGWNEATNTLVRNETEVLKHLAASSFHSFTAPHLVHSGLWNGRFLCVQASVEGRIQPAPRDMTPQYLGALQELALQYTESMPLKDSPFWINLLERIEKIPSKRSPHILRQGVRAVEDWLSNTRLPFHFCHGDFAPWNAKLDNGRLLLFDWEYADLKAPPGWDLFHFIVQTLWLLQKRTPGEIHKAVLKDAMQNESIRMYLESLNIKEGHLRPLFLAYLLNRLAFYASDHDADQGRLRYFANMSSLILFDEKCSQ